MIFLGSCFISQASFQAAMVEKIFAQPRLFYINNSRYKSENV